MRTHLLTPLLLLSAIFVFGQKSDETIITENIAAFSKALMARDIDFIVNSYTEDASIFPNGTDIIKGRDRIRRYWTPAAGDTTTFHKIYPEEISVVGDTAYDYGYYEIAGLTQGKPYEKVRGKYVIVWKRSPGGWKIYLDIWNRARAL